MAMPTPKLKSGAEAQALDGAANTDLNLTHIADALVGWSETYRVHFDWLWARLADLFQLGMVYPSSGGGLNIGVAVCNYEIGGVLKTYAGITDQLLTDAVTNYMWLDSSGALNINTSAYGAGEIHKLARVVCAGGAITSVTPDLGRNFGRSVTAWSAQVATASPDLNGYDLTDVGILNMDTSTELTIAAGVVTAVNGQHSIDTEADAATDNLATISGGTDGDWMVIKPENVARVVTVQDGVGNIKMAHGDYAMSADDYWLLLIFDGTNWYGLPFNTSPRTLTADMDVAGYDLNNVGILGFDAAAELTIATGSIAATQTYHTVDTEADAATDDLDTITGGVEGDELILRAENTARTVVVKNGTGNILLPNGDYTIDDAEKMITLLYDGTNWREKARSFVDANAIAQAADKGVPWCPTAYFGTEALAGTGDLGARIYVPYACVLRDFRAEVETAPAGAILIIDLKVNGVSIFAAAAEMANIAIAANGDTSATKDVAVSAGDIITINVNQADATAANLTCTLRALMAAQVPV